MSHSKIALAILFVLVTALPALANPAPSPDALTLISELRTGPTNLEQPAQGNECAAAPLPAGKRKSFCDGSHGAGTSKSCKTWGKTNGDISCPAGSHIANLTCSVRADKLCPSGYYCSCSWECRKNLEAEPEEPLATD